jgi:pSer/pThr/pTyr-binding forkhead associated (FHA) protein
VRLDTELCRDQSTWLLVEVRPFRAHLFMSVLRVEHVLVIGRDPACGLVLEGALVSRRHALLCATETTLEVEDISRHGTLVNGLPLVASRVKIEREVNLVIGCNRVRLRRLG